ncbi:SRPBCC family protein [Haloparvum sp. AD34]
MREVEASRFVAATPDQLQRRLTPETVIAAEGSFTVRDVREHVDEGGDGGAESEDASEAPDAPDGDATDVVVGGPGIEFTLRFSELEHGWYYTKIGEAAPIDHLETWLTVEPEDEGSRVTMRSAVAVGLSVPFIDRIAGWKRRGELQRALDALAADVS